MYKQYQTKSSKKETQQNYRMKYWHKKNFPNWFLLRAGCASCIFTWQEPSGMSDFRVEKRSRSKSGETCLLRALLFSREKGWTHLGRCPLLTAVWLIPGESLWAPCTSLPLPGVGGRLHGDGSAWHLLHLLIAQLWGQGCAGGRVSREVRACFC